MFDDKVGKERNLPSTLRTCLAEDVFFKEANFLVQGAANQLSNSILLLPVQLWTIYCIMNINCVIR